MATSTMRNLCQALARTVLLVLLAGSSQPVLALGVGEPQILSGFGEPLRVRVPVNLDTAEERAAADTVHADLIPDSEYPRYGVAEQTVEVGALYAVTRSAGSRAWIEIGSRQTMREPAAILLLRVRLGGNMIVKEVPLLFDFKPSAREAEEPAAAGEPAADLAMAPLAPPAARPAARTPSAPVAAAAAAREHRPRPVVREALAAPAAAPVVPALPAPQPGLRYSSAVLGLRLAESFDSLAEWQLAHPPADVPPVAVPAVPAPVAAQAAGPQQRQPPPAPAVAPEAAEASRWVWISWLFTAALLAGLWLLLRRRGVQHAPNPAAAATPAPEAATGEAPAADDPATPIRERLRKLSRGKLDRDLARRALLVDAFLDLKRYDSAERLLLELEQELALAGPSREGRADVAAAVRR